MPKVTYTPAQGLVQSAGSGVSFGGSQFVGATQKVNATTKTLTLADSGCVLIPTAGAAQTFTLPSVTTAAGFCVTLVAGSAQAHVINGGGTKIQGVNYNNGGAAAFERAAISNKSSLTLATPAIGDYITVVGDGTNYYVYSWTNAALTLA